MFTKILCFLALVHIIVESLPISSSGHLRLLTHFLANDQGQALSILSHYEYLLHIPNLIILTLFLKRRWVLLMLHPWRCRSLIARLMLLGMCAEIPTLLAYVGLKASGYTMPLWAGFGVTALTSLSLLLPYGPRTLQGAKVAIGCRQAFIIGCVQGMSLLPGISRLGTTYAAGRWLGIAPLTSFIFSLTIEWPLLAAAIFYDLGVREAPNGCLRSWLFVVCLMVAGAISYAVLAWVQAMALRGTWWKFGVYLLIPLMFSFLLP